MYHVFEVVEGSIFVYILMLILFSCSIVSGVLLLCGKRLGFILSIINQILQVPRIFLNGFVFNYLAGSTINIDFYKANDTIGFRFFFWLFRSNFFLSSSNDERFLLIGINLLAIIIAIYLFKELKKKEDIINLGMVQSRDRGVKYEQKIH